MEISPSKKSPKLGKRKASFVPQLNPLKGESYTDLQRSAKVCKGKKKPSALPTSTSLRILHELRIEGTEDKHMAKTNG